MRSIRLVNLKITNVKNKIVYFDLELEYTWLWMINAKREYKGVMKNFDTFQASPFQADTGEPFHFKDLYISNAITTEINRLID